MSRLAFLALAAPALLAAAPAHASPLRPADLPADVPADVPAVRPAATDTLRGRVTDTAGGPLADVDVAVVELERRTRTGRDGAFVIAGVPAGTYTLRFRAPGYGVAVQRVAAGTPAAQSLAPRVVELEAVTVTAGRGPGDPERSPLPTSVLGEERLRREHSVSLARTLATLPGVRSLSTGEQVGKPVIRGLHGAQVAVLSDGVRLEDFSWSDEDAPSVDARLASRVEVIRGPASLLYGSDAMGGVVNVIPEPLPDAPGGRRFTRGTAETYFATGNREGGLVLAGEGASGRFGWRAVGIGRKGEDIHTPGGPVENTGFFAVNGEAAAGLRGDWGSATLRYQRYGGEFKLLEASGAGSGGAAEGEEEGPERKAADDRVQLSGVFPMRGVRVDARTQLQRHWLQEVADEPAAGGAPTGTESVQFDLLLNTFAADVAAHLGDGTRARTTLGVSGMAQGSDSRGPIPLIPDARTRSAGVFALEEVDVGPVRVMGGARVDHRSGTADPNATLSLAATDTRDYTAPSWNVGAAWTVVGPLTLTASVGRAWRAPTLFELYTNGPRLGEARYDVGDASLGVEHTLSVDVGARVSAGSVRLEASAFRNRVHDYITANPTADQVNGLRVYRYAATEAELKGIEAGAEVRPIAALALRATADAVRGRDLTQGGNLPFIPPARARLEAEGRRALARGSAYASLAVEGEARQKNPAANELAPPAWARLDLGAGTERPVAGRVMRIDLQVRNLTDVAYRDFLNRYKEFALDQGRSVTLRLSTDF
jgi:iron complex outermembrane receptor protein